MLPWIFIHGYLFSGDEETVIYYLLQCCHGFSSMDTINKSLKNRGLHPSFNVAMDFHPWIQSMDFADYTSHFRFNVAMDFHPWILMSNNKGNVATMRFNVAMDFHPWILCNTSARRSITACFNVAMDFHPWILENNVKSMKNLPKLQCCHGFSSMDTGWPE